MGRARKLGMCSLDLAAVVAIKGGISPKAKQIPLGGSAGIRQPPRLLLTTAA